MASRPWMPSEREENNKKKNGGGVKINYIKQ